MEKRKYYVARHPCQPGEFLIPDGLEKNVQSAMRYEAQSGDLFMCSYPKCGITWLQNIVWRLLHDGKPFEGHLLDNIAFLEFDGGEAVEETRKRASKYHIIKTHFPYKWVPKHPEAKYIFIAREPKDVCVSLYYHVKGFRGGRWEDGSFNDLAVAFLEGNVDCCSYFEMLNEWYSHRNDPSTLFLLYEDLLRDTKFTILKIADFLGAEIVENLEKNNHEVLDEILRATSITKMKEKDDQWVRGERVIPFIRKGIIGDWKNHMTSNQAAAFDEKLKMVATEVAAKTCG